MNTNLLLQKPMHHKGLTQASAQVRTVLAALTAPELLKSTRGALVWHGRDLRRYRRLLSPPLQRLLTCPGAAPAPQCLVFHI